MIRLWKVLLGVILACACAIPCVAQCGFEVEPANFMHWYRNEGWPLPGLKDPKTIRPFIITVNGKQQSWPEGITVSLIEHGKDYQVKFPTMIFDDNGSRKKLQHRNFYLEQLLRWRYRGRTYAYSYYLYPPNMACDSMIEIIESAPDTVPAAGMNPAGLRHLALTVADFPEVYARLKAKSVRFLTDAQTAHGNSVVFFTDPDGNVLHLLHRETPLP